MGLKENSLLSSSFLNRFGLSLRRLFAKLLFSFLLSERPKIIWGFPDSY